MMMASFVFFLEVIRRLNDKDRDLATFSNGA